LSIASREPGNRLQEPQGRSQPLGRNPEHRFNFIQNRAGELDRDLIDA